MMARLGIKSRKAFKKWLKKQRRRERMDHPTEKTFGIPESMEEAEK